MENTSETLSLDTLATEHLPPQGEMIIGTLTDIDSLGRPLVSFQLNKLFTQVPAITTTQVSNELIGRQVGLLFSQQDNSPIIVGVIHSPLMSILDSIEVVNSDDKTLFEPKTAQEQPLSGADALIDGERVVIQGKDEVVLKCGESSITLNKNGKISIRGKYLLNRSTGVNRIMGGSVQVN